MGKQAEILKKVKLYESLDDQEVMRLIDLVKDGVAYSTFNTIMTRSYFSIREWSNFLNTSERTLQRYKKEKRSFDPAQSERIIQIEMIQQLGHKVFGSPEAFNQWLDMPSIALGGRKPINLLDSSFGIDLVRDELRRIEYGVLA